MDETGCLLKTLAGDVDPDEYDDCDKGVVLRIPAVGADKLGWRQKLIKKIIKKTWNPDYEFMDLSSEEDLDEEVRDTENIKSTLEASQVIDKIVRFSLLIWQRESSWFTGT